MPDCPSSTELWLLDKQTSRAGISEPVVLASFKAWWSLGLYLHHSIKLREGKMQLPLARWEAAPSCWHPVAWDCLSWEKQEGLEPPHLTLILISCECNWLKQTHMRQGLMREEGKPGPHLSCKSRFFLDVWNQNRTGFCKALVYLLVHPAYSQIFYIISNIGVQSDTLSCALDFQVCCR